MKRWSVKPLGEVCSVNPKLAASDAPAADTEVTFVPMAAVDEVSGTIARPEHRRYSEVAKGYTSFRENDVLFAKITPCMQNGKTAVASNLCNGFGFGSTEFHVLRSTGSVLPRWVFAFIRQPAFRNAAEGSFTGSAGQQRVPSDFLKAFPIPVPPLAEQERLVKLLDEADELRKLRAQADRRTADLIPALFHDMFGDPLANPKAWPESIFADHLELLEYGPRFYNEAYSEAGPRIVRITDLDGAGNLNFSTMPRLQVDSAIFEARGLKPGELIFARSGATVGKVAIVPDNAPPCIAGAYFIRLRFEPSIHPVYAAYLIRCPSVQGIIINNSKQSAQQNFSGPGIRSLPLPVPPLPLQKKFAARVSDIRAMQAEQGTSRRRLDDLFQSMLHRAFQGEL